MDLLNRANLAHDPDLRKRVENALAKEITTLLRTKYADQTTDAARKQLRVRQRWALSALGDQQLLHKVMLMVTSSMTDAALDNGLTDSEIAMAALIAVDALSGLEYHVPTETLPV